MMKTSELIGPALDWAVATCEGVPLYIGNHARLDRMDVPATDDGGWEVYRPSTDWAQGGPIIERERIDVWCYDSDLSIFRANIQGSKKADRQGTTPLIAAMRCYVASKLGDEIEIPKELLK